MKPAAVNRDKKISIIQYAEDGSSVKEYIPSITVALDVNGAIRVSALIEAIKKRGVVSKVENQMISYYSSESDYFVYLGIDPLPSDKTIPFVSSPELIFKFRPKATPSYGDVLLGSVSGNISKGSRRTKERKIGDVIKKVS